MTDAHAGSTLTAETPAPPAAPPATATATLPPAASGWGAELAALCSLVALVAFGQALFYRTPPALLLGPVAGLLVASAVRRWWSAGAIAFVGTLLGAVVATFIGGLVFAQYALWLPGTLEAAAIAAALAAAGSVVARARRGAARVIPLLGVAALIAVMWVSGLALAEQPNSAGQTSVVRFATPPTIDTQMTDESTYLIWIERVRSGEPYYPMAVRTFQQQERVFGDRSLVRIDSPLSYRPPTLTYLLATLPPGIAYVWAMLAWCSVGVVAAYLLVRRFMGATAALLGAGLVASMFSGFASVQLVEAEAWACVMVLASVASYVYARRDDRWGRAAHAASIAFALVAVAFREIALPVLLLGLAGSLAAEELRAGRTWRGWAAGLAIAVLGLAAHWLAAAHAFAGIAGHAVASTWFHPNGSGLVGAGFLLAALMVLQFGVVLVILGGMVGALVGPRQLSERIMVAGVATGGPLALMLVHPPGWTSSHVAPGYWGFLVFPTVLACVPLIASRMGRTKLAQPDGVSPTTS